MDWKLPPLPYDLRALEPHIGAEALTYHHEKHQGGYLAKLRDAIGDSPLAKCSLSELVVGSDGKVFHLAAQVWNHTFYWHSLSPDGGGEPPDDVRRELEGDLGSYAEIRTKLLDAAANRFGSGYVWLYSQFDGRLAVRATHDAMNPLLDGVMPLFTIDLWEHGYYLDYHNERERYVQTVLDHLIDWKFVVEGREQLRRGWPVNGDAARAPAGSP